MVKNYHLYKALVCLILGISGMSNLLAQNNPQSSIPMGAVNGSFTINGNGDKVMFSQGNLQYIGSAETPYWKLADHQWDYFGFGYNTNIQNDFHDLFGWGTSGYNHGARFYVPWATNSTGNSTVNQYYYAYGSYSYNLFDQTGQADWGYNAIVNGGNQENCGWRTLTNAEWKYLFNSRNTSSGIRYAKAMVNNINGIILLPDDWRSSYHTLNSANSNTISYAANTLTSEQWVLLEQFGAVFLPAAGCRQGPSDSSNSGYYWSSSRYGQNTTDAYCIYFKDDSFSANYHYNRYSRFSVRLVQPAPTVFSINAIPNTTGGAVSGAGIYEAGAECTLTATASAGNAFACWIENGIIVSTDATFSFVVCRERDLVAYFSAEGNITFSDASVKALCVANWDSNGDGELSYAETAAVTSLGNVFKNNTNIHSFNELQYFVSLYSIGAQAFYGCTELTQVIIPENVTSVGSKAFWNCPALQTVRFNAISCFSMQTTYNSNTYSVFSSDANGSASNLKSVMIGTNVQRIPDYAFKDCVDIYPGLSIRSSVTEIGAHAFENCSSITTLSFQNNSTLSTIGDYAFSGCSAMNRALNLPDSVVSVGQYAFYGCLAIPSLTIGTSVETIGDYAFWNCPALVAVDFNATNCVQMNTKTGTSYPGFQFYSVFNSGTSDGGTTSIVSLTIGENVTKIPEYAFRNSTNLISELTIPDATTFIGQYAFYGAKSAELTIGEGVDTVGEYAFWDCPNLATVHFNAANCTEMYTKVEINSSTYQYCSVFGTSTNIINLTIGENVTRIPDYAFSVSENITHSITISDAITYIGQNAFSCIASSELAIGTGVTEIGDRAFWNCPNLSTVHFNATNCTKMHTKVETSSSDYQYFSVFGMSTNIINLTIGENVTNIPDYAFRSSSIANGNLLLPSGLTNIGQYAFYGCGGFTGGLVIPNSVSSIGQYAFTGCSGFDGTLSLPVNESYTTINQYSFYGCSGLTGTLMIPANVTEVAHSAFRGCSGFNNALTLHNALATIGEYAFYGCSSIPELTIGEGMTNIGGYAFWNCPNLATVHYNATHCTQMYTKPGTIYYSVFDIGIATKITPIVILTIGENVTNIPDYAFRYSNNMTCDIIIPDAVTSIGTYAFANCSGHNVFIGNSVTSIPDYSFYQSSGINGTLTLGNALENIGQYAFQGCCGFTGDLVVPNAVATIGQYAFQDCSGFDGSLIIGRGIQTINQFTFANCSGFSGALILGTQVNSIANYAFQNCSAFSLVISENPNPITATSSSFTGMDYSIPVYVPDGLVNNYQNSTGWNNFTNYIEQFTFWDNLDSANWSDEMNWLSMEFPTANDVVCITYNCDLDIDFDVLYVYIYNINDVLTIKSDKTLYTTYGVGLMNPSQLVIEPGGQVIYGNMTNNVTQTVSLAAGANYVSFNVETSLSDLQTALTDALGTTGVTMSIKSQTEYTELKRGKWTTGFSNFNVSEMFIINVSSACEITLTGAPIDAAAQTITIVPGANWIAYPLSQPMTITNVFTGFVGTNDALTSQTQYSKYTRGKWSTEIELQPGQGYIYGSAATGDRTFVFPVSK